MPRSYYFPNRGLRVKEYMESRPHVLQEYLPEFPPSQTLSILPFALRKHASLYAQLMFATSALRRGDWNRDAGSKSEIAILGLNFPMQEVSSQ
jgi:hypothetical protein